MRMLSRPLLFLVFGAACLRPLPSHSQTVPPGPTDADVFNGDVVQQIHLFLNSKDWKALQENYRENTYYPADLHWNGQVVRNIGIRSRGGGSRNAIKPGLRLDFDRYATTQKFLGLKSLVLDNLVQDLPMMRERLAMTFLARMGRPAPRVVHTGLWVNNIFIGLYTIVESIDKDFLERTLGEDNGYYQYNFVPQWYFEDSPNVPLTLDNLVRIFEPKTRESDPLSEQEGPIQQMLNDINHASDFVGAVSRDLDLEDLVRYVATEHFLAEHDGILGYDGANNFYFYRSVKTGTGRFLPWDRDNAFYKWNWSMWQNVDVNRLVSRALDDPHLRTVYIDTMEQAAILAAAPPDSPPPAGEPVQGWLEREIRRVYAQISEGAHADGAKLVTNEKFEEEVEWLLEFARHRSALILDEVRRERRR